MAAIRPLPHSRYQNESPSSNKATPPSPLHHNISSLPVIYYDTRRIFAAAFGDAPTTQTFEDFGAFESAFAAFQRQTGAVFRVKSSVGVGAENKKRTPKNMIPERFKYAGVTYICVRHGTNKVKGASCDCKAYLSLSFKTSIQKLYITSANTQHNHPLPIKNPEIVVIKDGREDHLPIESSPPFDSACCGDSSDFYLDRVNFMESNNDDKKLNSEPMPNLKRELDLDTETVPSKIPKLDDEGSAKAKSHTATTPAITVKSEVASGGSKSTPATVNSINQATNKSSITPSSTGTPQHSNNQQQQHQNLLHSAVPQQSKYAQLLAVIEDMGRDIRPAYAGSKVAAERLKRGIIHSRILVRECLLEAEKCART